MKYVFSFLLLCLSYGNLQAQTTVNLPLITWQDLQQLPTPTAGQRISYGQDSLQFGELRLPVGKGPFPVVVVIHGGCWLNQFNYQYMNHLSAALTQAGYATWNIEFRRVGDVGGGWPGTFLDVAKGVDFVRELAKLHPLDKKQVVVLGHSAGGHLALWVAGRYKIDKKSELHTRRPLKVKGVVSLAGIPDLATYAAEKGSCNSAVEKLMGGSATQFPERYAAATPSLQISFKMKVKMVQGEKDPIVPVSQANNFVQHASHKKYQARVVLLPNAGHFDLVAPTSPVWPSIEQAVREVLKK